jgi:hypothetical protein
MVGGVFEVKVQQTTLAAPDTGHLNPRVFGAVDHRLDARV